jgi:hypothetical protein
VAAAAAGLKALGAHPVGPVPRPVGRPTGPAANRAESFGDEVGEAVAKGSGRRFET